MKKPILLLDLDRTLFNTEYFTKTLWSFMVAAYNIDLNAELEKAKKFYHYSGEMYDYDFRQHIRSLGLDPEVVKEVFLDQYRHETFIYDDTKEVLGLGQEYDIRLLTYGGEWYQLFKIATCSELSHVPVDIVLEQKADYLRNRYVKDDVTLVDDKLLTEYSGAEWPAHVQFIWLNRELVHPIEAHDNYIAIQSFTQLRKALQGDRL